MKKIFSIIALSISILIISSCEDFLVKPPQGELTQSNFPQSESDLLLATNAIYNTLRNSDFHFGLFPIMDIMSDDTRKGSNPDDASAAINPYDNFTFLATESNLSRWWNALYLGVKRANVVIEYAETITMDETLKARYLGEARFLRALFYFDLVRAWGDVPLVTSTTPDLTTGRTPKADVYSLIVADLTAAAASLPLKSEYSGDNIGRATSGAAKALLAKVYLFLGDFAKARDFALEVINSGQYTLEADFADANSILGEHGTESVFEAGAFAKEGLANGGNQYGNVQGVRGTPNRGWGFNRPSVNLMNSFETNDPRLEKSVIRLGEVLDGVTILGDGLTPDETYDGSGNLIEIECYNQKVWTPGQTVDTQFGHNRRFLRYADVLLMAAEALNETGNAAQALVYLNEIRLRARNGNASLLPDISETNQSLLRDIIFNERRHELAMEGHRFWDLIRTNRATTVLGTLGFITGKNELLPIPQSELDLTGNKWSQNPGWE
jgi:hypothetical protein